MFCKRFRVRMILPVLILCGCWSDQPAINDHFKATTAKLTPPSAISTSYVDSKTEPVIEVSPAAKSQLLRISQERSPGNVCRVRLEVKQGGCTGMTSHLWLDMDPLQPQDASCQCGEVTCVYLTEQYPLVQGALIDWVRKETQQGFSVTFPRKTPANQEKMKKWIEEGFEESRKKAKEEINTRIAQFEKMAREDPENELAHFRLAQLLMDDEQYADAVKSFEETIKLAPKFSKAYQLLGECLIELKQNDRAIEVFTKGWITANETGDKTRREEIAKLLTDLGASPPKD